MCATLCHSASSIMMPHSVILNAVKNLLKADKRQPALIAHNQRLRLPRLVPSLAMTVDSV